MTTIQSDSATVTSVASSASNVTLFAAAQKVSGRIIYNDSTSIVYVKFGAGASTTSYTVQVPSQASYDFGARGNEVYAGQVDAVWASANGSARLTSW